MLNRRLVIGSLVAGAFLLPAVAGAAVTGVCSNCHTMHASQNGVAAAANSTLLKTGADCFSCHADATLENDATGRDTGTVKAPQVDNTVGGTLGYVNNGGFFDAAADDNTHHNVVGIDANSDVNMGTAALAPGGTMAVDDGAGAPVLTCAGCHTGSGAHHGTSPSNYRILGGTLVTAAVATSAQTDFGAAQKTAVTVNEGNRAEVAYNATQMNNFCAGCHGGFHQSATPNSAAGTQRGNAVNSWVRHPTDLSLVAAVAAGNAPSIDAVDGIYNAASDVDAVPVGTAGADTDVVMCISCHVPHGGRYADLLAFPYDNTLYPTSNAAGDGTKSVGCETCHSYAAAGM